MYCPRCRAEYREGFTHCANCEVELVNELPAEDTFASAETMAKALADKELQALLVGNHMDLTEAQRFLAQKRVASTLAGEADENNELPAVAQRFFLMVAVEDLESARDAINTRWREGAIAQGMLLSDEDAQVGTCPACKATVPANATECPDCGLFLGDAEKTSE
ncbi:MAG: hypothetical protein JW841_15845 [Deltaproteobacteria bacterium]|nr:hypothetical protein [Deltaproteobacteria bacterium]